MKIEPIKNQNQDYILITSQKVPVLAENQINVDFEIKRPMGPSNEFLETLFVCEVAEKKDVPPSRNFYPKTFLPESEIDDGSPNENDENAEKMLPNHCSDQANEKFENSPITENAQVCCRAQGSPII